MFKHELNAQDKNYFNTGIFIELLMFRKDTGHRNQLESYLLNIEKI